MVEKLQKIRKVFDYAVLFAIVAMVSCILIFRTGYIFNDLKEIFSSLGNAFKDVFVIVATSLLVVGEAVWIIFAKKKKCKYAGPIYLLLFYLTLVLGHVFTDSLSLFKSDVEVLHGGKVFLVIYILLIIALFAIGVVSFLKGFILKDKASEKCEKTLSIIKVVSYAIVIIGVLMYLSWRFSHLFEDIADIFVYIFEYLFLSKFGITNILAILLVVAIIVLAVLWIRKDIKDKRLPDGAIACIFGALFLCAGISYSNMLKNFFNGASTINGLFMYIAYWFLLVVLCAAVIFRIVDTILYKPVEEINPEDLNKERPAPKPVEEVQEEVEEPQEEPEEAEEPQEEPEEAEEPQEEPEEVEEPQEELEEAEEAKDEEDFFAPFEEEKQENKEVEDLSAVVEQIEEPQDLKFTYKKTLPVRLKMASSRTKEFYSELRNRLSKYNELKVKDDNGGTKFMLDGKLVAYLGVFAKFIKLYLPLNPDKYPVSTYHHKNVGEKKKYVNAPFLLKVGSSRSYKYSEKLITDAVRKLKLTVNEAYEHVDYVTPYQTTSKELVEIQNLGFLLKDSTTIEDAKIMPKRGANGALILENKELSKGKKLTAEVSIETLLNNFSSNDVIDMKALKDKDLIANNINWLKIVPSDECNKMITVKANEYDLDALKMIVITGGTAVKIIKL